MIVRSPLRLPIAPPSLAELFVNVLPAIDRLAAAEPVDRAAGEVLAGHRRVVVVERAVDHGQAAAVAIDRGAALGRVVAARGRSCRREREPLHGQARRRRVVVRVEIQDARAAAAAQRHGAAAVEHGLLRERDRRRHRDRRSAPPQLNVDRAAAAPRLLQRRLGAAPRGAVADDRRSAPRYRRARARHTPRPAAGHSSHRHRRRRSFRRHMRRRSAGHPGSAWIPVSHYFLRPRYSSSGPMSGALP